MNLNSQWPVLTAYEGRFLRRVALPLGGIGTGTISLGGRGDLRDWEIMNKPAKGFTPGTGYSGVVETAPMFALWTKTADGTTDTRVLEGMLATEDYEGPFGTPGHQFKGLPRFHEARFDCAYPLAQVSLKHDKTPVEVRLEAWNPLVPGDADASSFPVVALRYVLKNPTNEPIEVAICGVLPNFVGVGPKKPRPNNPDWRNVFRQNGELQGVFCDYPALGALNEENGSLALCVWGEKAQNVSHRLDWAERTWFRGLLDFWDDFSADGRLEPRPIVSGEPTASLAVSATLAPGEERSFEFGIAWHFPNRKVWHPGPMELDENGDDPNQVGNYYATKFADAWDVATQFGAQKADLEAVTVRFVRAFCASDFPAEVKEAALYNASTLRTQTVFRLPSGHLMGWEGCGDDSGSCAGSCSHVWGYETAVGFLFGELARSMREVEFLFATLENGLTCFRVMLPLETQGNTWLHAAADGQMGTLVRLYRDWKLCGDDAWLQKVWPKAKKALEFAWLLGGWDADGDGVMEGSQHNTMDVEYYGPNPQMTFWYLAALRACEEMAKHLGETDFSQKCRDLYESGRVKVDELLWNGEYYEQQICPVPAEPLEGTHQTPLNPPGRQDPDLQIGAGCLVDQMVGQYAAHVCDLGHLADPEKAKKAVQSVLKYNWKSPLNDHFNHMRTFVQGDESALIMCSYPRGNRPRQPFPYYGEVMTGFEYTAACGALYEGDIEGGLKAIRAIRERYDGAKRSPFNEAECGHHYARAMASWTAVLALSGFHYSAVSGQMKFAANEKATWFWSNGSAWGTFSQENGAVSLKALFGEVKISELRVGERVFRPERVLKAGEEFSA